jgi:hypothetical protein
MAHGPCTVTISAARTSSRTPIAPMKTTHLRLLSVLVLAGDEFLGRPVRPAKAQELRAAIFPAFNSPRCQMVNSKKTQKKRTPGRPYGSRTSFIGEAMGLRLYPDIEAKLDAWIAEQGEPGLGRPEAIRRLLVQALTAPSTQGELWPAKPPRSWRLKQDEP